jgi:hypothetical protein
MIVVLVGEGIRSSRATPGGDRLRGLQASRNTNGDEYITVVPHERGVAVVYMICEPASHDDPVMIRSNRMADQTRVCHTGRLAPGRRKSGLSMCRTAAGSLR